MQLHKIPYQDTGYFSGLIADYLDRKASLKPFYNRFPALAEFEAQCEEKQGSFPQEHREVLVRELQDQYRELKVSEETLLHIESLSDSKTFTVVTGHQLNLFTGPLYFHYKIATAIGLCRRLREAYPQYNFVPVYWMATEDHDFEEINHFNFTGKEFRWNRPSGGAVGRMDTDGLQAVLEAFSGELGQGKAADRLRELFTSAYLKDMDLASATRYLVNELFGPEGLVIIDADRPALKKLFIPHMRQDLLEHMAYDTVSRDAEALGKVDQNYPIQVNPREINLFYLTEGSRERIVKEGEQYGVLNTSISFSKEELLADLEEHPERYSPNVITRPLYQEVILPNLCYIGGGGELAYWLELHGYFKKSAIPFPILLLRNSALFISDKKVQKAGKLNLSIQELFQKQNTLINRKIRQISNIDIDFSPQRKHLKEQFEAMHELAAQTDPSFLGAVRAQEKKQLNGLDHLEKRLLKAQKRKLKDQVNRMVELQNDLFPGQGLQERNRNFAELYLELGDNWVPALLEGLNPLELVFTVFEYPR
ncbi:bacillithiol biosynthesis cysteine-adding enzyme BshC [Robiginitalea myxolifaciens]|uniref:Putative cysteine ligase BshC n=1 Tax=Robiginitalea myxolifaciens TaxID=400055 RepID=A0A1I6H572_9FLAO|nr:bacillithiol biosynthesis cysteine-adding enzyme BshC [Robiginitalea myxolifaciens]SFR49554.1 bacillithiol biosynthesis cysteine-adding enzyme BshC [Robiginitalea myxolifaciens]